MCFIVLQNVCLYSNSCDNYSASYALFMVEMCSQTYVDLHVRCSFFPPNLTKIGICTQLNFHCQILWSLSSGSRIFTCRHTDMRAWRSRQARFLQICSLKEHKIVTAIYESLELLGIRADYPGFGTQTTGYSGFSSRWDQRLSVPDSAQTRCGFHPASCV